ncbi:uncharacterized protein LOC110459881 [Mizuhopecten yessoensis]|uniref:uncharacterized protein LOC110459881 n=1 Tax=Mizuhopecten yessoensis TaxID=6573 RepID=UPI000B45E2FF|nr:uncharacterized protein LOC110459881 [Mizuhopecten yessoensis]
MNVTVLGLAVMVPGIVMLTNIDFLSGNIEPLLDKISFNGINLSNIANNLPIIFIIVGASILFIAVLGLVGACCKIKTLLVLMECCGVNPVTATTNDFDLTPWRIGDGASLKIPKGCCIGVTEDTYSAFAKTACTDTATSGTYHSDGCYDAIMSSFGSTLDMMGYICLGALLLQVCCTIINVSATC